MRFFKCSTEVSRKLESRAVSLLFSFLCEIVQNREKLQFIQCRWRIELLNIFLCRVKASGRFLMDFFIFFILEKFIDLEEALRKCKVVVGDGNCRFTDVTKK